MCPFSHPNHADHFTEQSARTGFEAFIGKSDYPCVGARSALNKRRIRFAHFDGLGDPATTPALRDALAAFSAEFPDPGHQPASFVATFGTAVSSELQFERLLWRQLQLLHDADHRLSPWNRSVSADPSDADFSMSVAGRAFFVVGMHPLASRMARRSPQPTLVFNFHDQFVALKESGKYATMQQVIRERDTALQGSINPILARFGEASEARQYSGRAVAGDWACPFTQRSVSDV